MSSIPPSRLPRRGVGPSAPTNWSELEAKYKQDIEALTESTEMATIEKEIAEERLDSCEKELKDMKEKLSEALAQIDHLKKDEHAANKSVTMGGQSESAATVLQLRKVEEQNELLKQALIKLRDISAKDKQALEDLQIEHEELQIKTLDLEDKEQRYLEKIKIYEEQIDVCQNAQEMVETLTQQKTELEDRLKKLSEEIDELENLRDLNDQLLENARENEIELTGELDKLRMQISQVTSKKRDLEDYLMDKERSLTKLKEENRNMQEQIIRLKDQAKEGESIEQQKHQIENVAYKLNFSESKMAEKESELNRCKRNLAETEEQMNNLSLITKEQSSQIDDLKLQLDAKIGENSELQRALKRKMEEVSELEIRREMAEKKLASLQRDTESKLSNMSRILETMKGIEIQHEEEIKRLMEDNELIERERRDLRDQLNKTNRSLERSMQLGGGANMSSSMMTAQDTSLASLGITYATTHSNHSSPIHHGHTHQQHQQSQHQQHQVQLQQHFAAQSQSQTSQSSSLGGGQGSGGAGRNASLSSMIIDDSAYQNRVKGLTVAFDFANKRNQRLEIELALSELSKRDPPYNSTQYKFTHQFKQSQPKTSPVIFETSQIRTLQREALRLKRELRFHVINQQICTKTSQVSSQIRNDNFQRSRLALKYQLLENEVRGLLTTRPELNSFLPTNVGMPLSQSTPVKSCS